MASNLPPGVTDGMLPGNRPEDAAYEELCEAAAELITATEFLTFYKDDPERPADKMTGVRVTFGELRRVVVARARLLSAGKGT